MNINDALVKEYNRGFADGKASVEQEHGRWIVRTNFGNGCYEVKCSKCGETGFWQIQPPYCPYCGAPMDEEVTE